MDINRKAQIKKFINTMSKMRKLMLEVDICDFKGKTTTLLQFRGLIILDQFPGSTVNEIADIFFMSSGAISQYLNRLATAGLITKKADASDRRVNRIYLSKKGKTQLKLMQKGFYRKFEKLLTPLSNQELISLINIQQKLFTNLEKQHRDESS